MPEKLLNDRQIITAKPREKPYRLHDGGGLALRVSPTGAKSWEFRYTLPGATPGERTGQTLTIGKYPDLGLADARQQATQARTASAKGVHLTIAKRVAKAKRVARSASTFGHLSTRWLASEARRARWTEDYREEVASSLRNHLAKLDPLPVADVTAAVAAPIIRAAEARAPDMAKKVRSRLRAILDFATEEGLLVVNPIPAARPRKGGAERRHLPAVLDREHVGGILRAADQTDVCRGVRRAHLLTVFTAQRISEVANAEWSEFDLGAGLWSIPRSRMKRKDAARGAHVIPLPPRLLAMLVEWKRADGEGARWVCPSPTRNGPIVIDSVEKFYRRTLGLAGQHSPHSWRSVFSTWCRDAGKDGDVIESQLDHVVGSKVAQAYDRSNRFDLRLALVRWYEQQLIAARDGAQVVAITTKRGA